jgi:hypothetical protein
VVIEGQVREGFDVGECGEGTIHFQVSASYSEIRMSATVSNVIIGHLSAPAGDQHSRRCSRLKE